MDAPPETSHRWASHAALALILLAAAVALLLHAFHFRSVSDDAYISFTYARHLLAGDGLVFNRGERVMGYSNLAWVLLLAGLMKLGVAAPVAGKILGAAASVATLLVCAVYWYRRGCSRLVIGLGLTFIVSSGTFACWVFGGLEGPLFGLLLLGVVVLVSRPEAAPIPRRNLVFAGLLCGAMCLTRAEAVIYLVPVAFFVGVRTRGHAPVRSLFALIVPALLVFAANEAFILGYYGDLLPNSAYAKYHPLSGAIVARGWFLTRRFVEAHCYVPLLLPLAWLGTVAARRGRGREWLALLLMLGYLLFFLRIGGDALVYYRMWQPIVPLLALLAVESLQSLAGRKLLVRAAATVVFCCMMVAQLLNSFLGDDIAYLRSDDFHLARLEEVSRLMAQLPPQTVIAANVVGRIGFFAEHRVIDMLGLNDRHIARAPHKWLAIPGHGSHDGRYVLDQRPELILPGYPFTTARPLTTRELVWRAGYQSDFDLLALAEFPRRYRAASLRLPSGGYVNVWLRHDRDWGQFAFIQLAPDTPR